MPLISLTLLFFISTSSKQQDHLSHLNILMLIDEKAVERYKAVLETQSINWDPFQFIIEALDETKVNISFFFLLLFQSQISPLCLPQIL